MVAADGVSKRRRCLRLGAGLHCFAIRDAHSRRSRTSGKRPIKGRNFADEPTVTCFRPPSSKNIYGNRKRRLYDSPMSMTVNGEPAGRGRGAHAPRGVIRNELRLTGTHVGCDTAQCGACTIHMDGRAVKSCNMLAMQAEGAELLTIEGVAKPDGALHPMQESFREHHGLQCGFCTPGMIMSAIDLVKIHPNPSEETIRAELDGNLCRCTGYHNIVKAIKAAAAEM